MTSDAFFDFHEEHLLHPPHAIEAFVRKLTKGIEPIRRTINERRQAPRYRLTIVATVQDIDEQLQAVGDAFEVVTRDISTLGIGIPNTRPVETKYLGVQLTAPDGETIKLLTEVVRCEERENAYDIGVRILSKADTLSAA